jgi:predicted DNA-binding antitoxin AbrB/MazE fold protein
MTRRLEAIYEQGVLRPIEPLALAEHQRVRLTLEERPLSWPSTDPVDEQAKTAHSQRGGQSGRRGTAIFRQCAGR